MGGYAENLRAALAALDAVELMEIAPPRSRVAEWLHHRSISLRAVDYWRRYPSYMGYVRHLEADIAHILDHAYGHLAYALDSARTVVTCHDIFPLKRYHGELPSLAPQRVPPTTVQFSLSGLRRAAAVITPSQATKDDLVTHLHLDPARVKVVPNGIHPQFHPFDEDELAKASWRHPSWPRSAPAILCVDTGSPYKNQRSMLEVFARVRAVQKSAILVHRGDPFSAAYREHSQKLGVADAIVELGRVHASEMPAIYNQANVLLFPSYYEGFGWPPLEAMACGLPVVASTATAVTEVTAGRALTADPDDHDALAGHVLRALTDPGTREGLVRDGLAWASRYTWSAGAAATLAVYRDVLERANAVAGSRSC